MAAAKKPIIDGFIEWGPHAGGRVVGDLSKIKLCTQLCSEPEIYMYRIPFDNGPTKFTNCYVVKSKGQALLIDTGAALDDNAAITEAALAELGLSWGGAAYFFTHLHFDHASLAHLHAPLDAPMYLGRLEYQITSSEHSEDSVEELAAQWVKQGVHLEEIVEATHMLQYWNAHLSPERDLHLVVQDDVVELGDLRFRVIETPGHTAGHLSLFEPQSGILFGGDHVLFDVAPVLAGHSTAMNSIRAYVAALDRVAALPVTQLFHSHGDIRPDFRERIAFLRAHQLERTDEACALVAQMPGSRGIDIVRAMTWSALERFGTWENLPRLTQLIIIEAGIAVLGYLVEEGRITAETDDAGLLHYFPA